MADSVVWRSHIEARFRPRMPTWIVLLSYDLDLDMAGSTSGAIKVRKIDVAMFTELDFAFDDRQGLGSSYD